MHTLEGGIIDGILGAAHLACIGGDQTCGVVNHPFITKLEASAMVVITDISYKIGSGQYCIAEKYELDEVSQRILNADDALSIKKVKDKSTCFQLDPFHRNKTVKEKIHNKKAVADIIELLPLHPEGWEYRNMRMMENHVWSVIARRKKHSHTIWSRRGRNHLAKKCSGKLYEEVTEKLKCPVFQEEKVERKLLSMAGF